MASIYQTIAESVRDVVANVSGAPARVVVRDTDIAHPEEFPIVVITMGEESVIREVSGAGSVTDQGDKLVAYPIGLSIYATNLGDNQTLGSRQQFVERCQQALNKKSLAGASTVYGTKLERRSAWEHRPLRDGVEKSVFGVIFFSAETKLGN